MRRMTYLLLGILLGMTIVLSTVPIARGAPADPCSRTSWPLDSSADERPCPDSGTTFNRPPTVDQAPPSVLQGAGQPNWSQWCATPKGRCWLNPDAYGYYAPGQPCQCYMPWGAYNGEAE